MGSSVIEYNKILQDRLEEYKHIFALSSHGGVKIYPFNNSELVLGNHINDVWRVHLSVLLHRIRWKALWRISNKKRYLMNITPLANVIVKVCSIQWENLSAEVEVLKVGDGDVPSSKRIASLIELFPIEQDFDGDVWTIADELDKYRFFYQHVWFPWDDNDGDAADWLEAHLEGRLQLLYDMVTGEVRAEDSERIRYQVCEARKIQEEIEETETLLEELKGDLNGDEQNKDCISSDDMEILRLHVCKLDIQIRNEKKMEREESLIFHMLELQNRMEMIRQEVTMLEDPFIRKVLANEKIRRRKMEILINNKISSNINNDESKVEENMSPEIALIWEKSSIDKLKTILFLIESKIANEKKCVIYPSLQQAVDERNVESSSFLVCSGIHRLKHTEELLCPGTVIAGISQECEGRNTVIVGHSFGKVIMVVDWMGIPPINITETAVLENLHFDPYGVEAVLLVDKGAIRVNNCCFSHEEINPKLASVGELKMPSSSILQTFSGYKPSSQNMKTAYEDFPSLSMPTLPLSEAFDECPPLRGIAVGDGGKLLASGCHFQELHVGINIYSGAKVHLSKCTFSKCQVAIRIIIGSEVVVEECKFLQNIMHSIHICLETPGEHDEEMKDIMEGENDLLTSNWILERIPGVTFKNCTFANSPECKDLHLSLVNKEHNPAEKDGTYVNQTMEDFQEMSNNYGCIIDEKPEMDDSVVILSEITAREDKE